MPASTLCTATTPHPAAQVVSWAASPYYAAPGKTGQLAGRCHYGVDFAAALAQDNVFATQFHPEKSHTNGLQLLQNFLAWDGRW